jgi:hypothetical protein
MANPNRSLNRQSKVLPAPLAAPGGRDAALSSFRTYRPDIRRISLKAKPSNMDIKLVRGLAPPPVSIRPGSSSALRDVENSMLQNESVVAVFGEHQEADSAIKKLVDAGYAVDNLSIVGKGYHSEEKIVGFYNTGDRVKFWGKRGVLWGSLWGLFLGGVSLTLPAIGPVMVLGYLSTIVVSAVEGGIMLGGLSALGAALYSAGVPRDSVIQYEQAVKANGFLVIVHGALEELTRARAILALGKPSRLDLHDGLTTSLSEPPYIAPVPPAATFTAGR